MSEAGATSCWGEVYEQPSLDGLERVDGRPVEEWVNRHLPFVGTAVDWSRVRATRRHWLVDSEDDLPAVVNDLFAALPVSDGVVHVGDSLSPCAVRIPQGQLRNVLPRLLEVPEHHYLVADDGTWCAVFRLEGDVDLAIFD